jgi:hypothetical protein
MFNKLMIAARMCLGSRKLAGSKKIGEESLGMTEADLTKLWNVIPVGETSAASATAIWKRLGMYARSTVQHQLVWMAGNGRISRLTHRIPMGGEVRLYYRTREPSEGNHQYGFLQQD